MSISCLALLLLAALLTFLLDYLPKFFLRTLPEASNKFSRRWQRWWRPEQAWKPVKYSVDYGIEYNYDNSDLIEKFGAKNVSSILRPADQSELYLDNIKLNHSQQPSCALISFSMIN